MPLRGITSKLQKRDLDIYEAFCDVESVVKDVETIRRGIDERYESWYEEILHITRCTGGEEKQPRVVGRQQNRSNHQANSPKEYYKIAIMVPFCDEVLMQLSSRFSEDSKVSIRGLLRLAPPLLVKCDDSVLKSVVNDLKLYEIELPRYESLFLELQLWRDRWLRCSTKIPDTLHGALTLCDQQLFSNVHHLLQLGCVLPVTSCEAERSFSAFRRVKTVFRSCMGEERLSSLCLMHIHYDVQINSRAVVEEFIWKQPQRLFATLYHKDK